MLRARGDMPLLAGLLLMFGCDLLSRLTELRSSCMGGHWCAV
jgi:hypothetical protein